MRSQLFVPVVSAAGLLVIGHCISTLVQQPPSLQWLALAALTLLTGSFTIKIPSVAARLSVSETFVFASVLLFGTDAGTITVALEILIILVAGARTHDPLRILFNVSSAALSIWCSSLLFFFVSGIEPLGQGEAPLGTLILPLALLASVYFLLNSGMVATAVAIEKNGSPFAIWRSNFLPLAVNYLGGASVAALFVSYTQTIDLVAFGVIVPLLILSYLTFKHSFRRIDDATQHVEEMKRLYLSTIETLATAIDAKDQVTHGHIRRVQQLALGLARELGVTDRSQLQALEAAALLHDTGKLAIPEHILNKPGKLTRGEFEKMKEHAKLGADILSSIKFPYPVVPIVRHHHENWDGNGYPDGLKGTHIPIGARILAVVDCFDALTSDRPYRPKMSDADAMAILVQRRGTMYDPLIVDTFVAKWRQLASELTTEPEAEHTTPSRHDLSSPNHAPRGFTIQGTELEEPLGHLAEAAIARTGAELAVIFAADRETDRLMPLIARTQFGTPREVPCIPLGYGVSGWVAVNAKPLINADASLDFRDAAPMPGLVRSICVPVLIGGESCGVFSVYTTDPRGFNEEDKSAVQQLATHCAAEDGLTPFGAQLHSRKSRSESSTTVH